MERFCDFCHRRNNYLDPIKDIRVAIVDDDGWKGAIWSADSRWWLGWRPGSQMLFCLEGSLPQNLSAHEFFLIQLSWGKGDKGDDGGGWGRGRGPLPECCENLNKGSKDHTCGTILWRKHTSLDRSLEKVVPLQISVDFRFFKIGDIWMSKIG